MTLDRVEGAPGSPRAAARATLDWLAPLTLAYTVGVILFGAWVRISGSGDGCGDHWPTCQGEVLHVPREGKTWVELTHRLTSGLCLPLVVALGMVARRAAAEGSLARRAAGAAIALMVVEALIGMLLVKLRLVGDDASVARAVVIALHLVNTCLLTAALTLVTWPAAREVTAWPRATGEARLGLLLALGFLAVASLGALTALGDTLFPVPPGTLGLPDAASTRHFLEQLRVAHPLAALALAVGLLGVASRWGARSGLRRPARAVLGLTLLEVSLGALDVALGAPGWLQILHLLGANLLWLSLVWLLAAQRVSPVEQAAEAPAAVRPA